mmetsp:Transcript_30910/g.45806  ORF Transcript_30910/g.45806 Transcript_30910/m.45806 type:complete len:87 (+) Transcript_30910:600-860(+)
MDAGRGDRDHDLKIYPKKGRHQGKRDLEHTQQVFESAIERVSSVKSGFGREGFETHLSGATTDRMEGNTAMGLAMNSVRAIRKSLL